MISIGLTDEQRAVVVTDLKQHLANLQVLANKTQGFHWNVQDKNFPMLHETFEEQYNELQPMIDDTAERIRALGDCAPADLATYAEMARLSSASDLTNRDEMFAQLLADYELIIKTLREYESHAGDNNDEGSADFFIEHLRAFEKKAWMIRSSL